MRIIYENGVDDAVGFAMYRLSPRRRMATRWIFPPVLVAVLVVSGFFSARDSEISLATQMALNVVSVLIAVAAWFWYINWRERRLAEKYLSAGAGTLGRHEIVLDDDVLTESTEVNTSTYRLDSILRVERRAKHGLIYVGPGNAHVIPFRRVVKGDPEAFLSAVEKAVAAARAGG